MKYKFIILLFICFAIFSIANADTYNTTYWCHQESANTTNQSGTDNGCSLVYTGTYDIGSVLDWNGDASNIMDGGYSTYDGANKTSIPKTAIAYINYTKPNYDTANPTESRWWRARQGTIFSGSILDSCFSYDSNKIILRVDSFYNAANSCIDFFCYNGSWQKLGSCTNGTNFERFYEDSIAWAFELNTSYTNLTETLEHTVNRIWINATAGFLPEEIEFGTNKTGSFVYDNMNEYNSTNYYYDFNAGDIDIDATINYSYRWKSYNVASGWIYSYINGTTTVYNLDVKNSATSFYSKWINTTWYNEITLAQITGIDKSDVTYTYLFPDGETEDFEFTQSAVNSIAAWMYPNASFMEEHNLNIYYTTEDSGYQKRDYTISNGSFNISEQYNQSLYLLSDTEAQLLKLELIDWKDDPVSDAFIQVLRYYPDTNTYITVTNVQTDTLGEAVVYLQYNDIYYRFIITQDSEVLYTLSKKIITETPLQIQIPQSLEGNVWQDLGDLSYTYSYDSPTKTATYSIIDTSGKATGSTFYVYKKQMLNDTLICNESGTGSSVTLFCTLPDEENSYFLTGKVAYPEEVTVFSTWEDFTVAEFGLDGMIAVLLIVLTMALAGLFKPEASIFLAIAGLIVSQIFGFILVGWAAIISICIIGILMILVMNREN